MNNSFDPMQDPSRPSNKPVHPLERKPEPMPAARPAAPAPRVIFDQSKPALTYAITGLNVLIFVLDYFVFNGALLDMGAKNNAAIAAGQLWRLVTPMFLHGGFEHIGFNSIALLVLGPMVERYYGHARFAAIYFLSGFAGVVASFALGPYDSIGASGAITGLLGALIALLYLNRRIFVNTRLLLPWIAQMVIGTLLSFLSRGIDFWGHYGGLLLGLAGSWFIAPRYKVAQDFDGTIRVSDGSEQQTGWLIAVILAAALGGVVVAVILLRGAHLMP